MELSTSELARFRAGDPQLFEQIVERYKTGVYQLCYRMLRDADEAWDLSQECFLRIYRKAELYDPAFPLTPWVYRLSTRVVLNQLDRRRRRNEKPMSVMNLPEPADKGASSRELVERKEVSGSVDTALARLSTDDALVLRLRYLGEMTLAEVAAVLGITVQATKTRLFRARGRLKERMTCGDD